MKTLFQHKNGSRIYKDSNCIFEVVTLFKTIRFNVDYLPENTYPWFCGAVGDLFLELADLSKRSAQKEIQMALRNIIGL